MVARIDVTSSQVSGSGTSQITINPTSDLPAGETELYVLIDASAFDNAGSLSYAGISSSTALSFTTATLPSNTNPSLSSSSPSDNATDVALDANIVLNFSENVDVISGNITIKKTSDNSTFETIDVTSSNVTGTGSTQITINPSSNFDDEVEYYGLGVTAPPQNPYMLAKKVKNLYLKSRTEREAMSKAARKVAEKFYSREKISNEYLDVIEKLIPHKNF